MLNSCIENKHRLSLFKSFDICIGPEMFVLHKKLNIGIYLHLFFQFTFEKDKSFEFFFIITSARHNAACGGSMYDHLASLL